AHRGQTVRLLKTAAYHSSATSTLSEMVDRCAHSLDKAAAVPLTERLREQRTFLDKFWDRSDVRVELETRSEGDSEDSDPSVGNPSDRNSSDGDSSDRNSSVGDLSDSNPSVGDPS